MEKKNILVLCTANSCRSQMAEGYLKFYAGRKAQVFSAGVTPEGIHRKTVSVMYEDGIDVRHHTSNHIDDYKDLKFDYVITVCDEAPLVEAPEAVKLSYNFPNPMSTTGSIEEMRGEFRKVRDMIKIYCRDFVEQNLA